MLYAWDEIFTELLYNDDVTNGNVHWETSTTSSLFEAVGSFTLSSLNPQLSKGSLTYVATKRLSFCSYLYCVNNPTSL